MNPKSTNRIIPAFSEPDQAHAFSNAQGDSGERDRNEPAHCKALRIVAAAIRWNGLIITAPPPARHHTLLKPTFPLTGLIGPDDQGFLTSDGRFVSREDAFRIAAEAGQLTLPVTTLGTLFSEDLW